MKKKPRKEIKDIYIYTHRESCSGHGVVLCVLLREEILCGASKPAHSERWKSYMMAYCVRACYRDEAAHS